MKLISLIAILFLGGCADTSVVSQQIAGLENSEIKAVNSQDIRNKINQ